MYQDISQIEKKLTIHVSKTLALHTKRSPQETSKALLSWKRAQEFYDGMIEVLGPLKGKKLLEVGCGYALFLVICLKNGIWAVGVEPADQEFYKFTNKIGKEVLTKSGYSRNLIKNATGENLPYKKDTFEVVVSFYTLEHVQNVEEVLSEATRVLKVGGYLYMVIPNYGSFWEGHYGILWIPYLSKSLAKLYVKIWGKSAQPLMDLQLINQLTLENIIARLPLKVISWGNDQFIKKVQDTSLSEGTLGSAKKILDFWRSIKLLKVVAILATFIKAQTPIILVAQKTKSSKINRKDLR